MPFYPTFMAVTGVRAPLGTPMISKQGRAQSCSTHIAKRLAQARVRKDNSSASGGIFEGETADTTRSLST
jgi:hypothetical protein